jgi:hypothetical protein
MDWTTGLMTGAVVGAIAMASVGSMVHETRPKI